MKKIIKGIFNSISFKSKEDFEERRKSERISISVDVKIEIVNASDENKIKNGEILNAKTLNLSSGGLLMNEPNEYGAGGLLIETDKNIPVDTILNANFDLPIPGLSGEFTVEGKVLGNIPKKTKYHISIKFHKIIKHNFNKIKYDILKDLLDVNS